MQLFSFTDAADLVLSRLQKSFHRKQSKNYSLLGDQIKGCPYDVYLVGNQSPQPGRIQVSGFYANALQDLHQAWVRIYENPPDSLDFKQARAVIDSYGNQVSIRPGFLSFNLRRFSSAEDSPFFILVEKKFPVSATKQALWSLCNLWQVESGRIPLHTSAIIHAGHLYLFSGPSGAGKSTLADLSSAAGDEVLDEDQVMIYRNPDGAYSANAWGYSLKACGAPIRAYFRIVKDRADRLLPLTQTHTAKLLMEQSCAVTGNMLPEKSLIDLLMRMAEFARHVPGYELHFRKSADFWKLIDRELNI